MPSFDVLKKSGMCSVVAMTDLGGLNEDNEETDDLSYEDFIEYTYKILSAGDWVVQHTTWSNYRLDKFSFVVAYTGSPKQEEAVENLRKFGFEETPPAEAKKNGHTPEQEWRLHFMDARAFEKRLREEYSRLFEKKEEKLEYA